MALEEVLLGNLGGAPLVIIVVLAALIGSEAVLFFTFIAGAGNINVSFWVIYVSTFITILIADGVYYLIGRSKFIRNLTPKILKKKKYFKVLNEINDLTKRNLLIIHIFSKFIYGFRHMMNIYFGYYKIPYKEYLKKDIIALFFFFSIMLPLAWFAGEGAYISFGNVKKLEFYIGAAFCFAVLFFIFGKLLFNRLVKMLS